MLYLDSGTWIIIANEGLVAWAQGCTEYLRLNADDLAYLARAARGGVPSGDAESERFRRAGILAPGGGCNHTDVPLLDLPARGHEFQCAPRGSALRLRRDFACWSARGDFFAWSRVQGRPLLIPPSVVPLLAAFASGATIEEAARQAESAADRKQLEEAVNVLVRGGLLVDESVVLSEDAAFSKRVEARGTRLSARELLAPRINFHRSDGGSAEGRIPVYLIHSLLARPSASMPSAAERPFQRLSYLPTGLGMILAYAQAYAGGYLRRYYNFVEPFITDPDDLEDAVLAHGPGIALFSNYEWNLEVNLMISETLKECSPHFLTIHGGPSTPSYPDACARFMRAHRHVDLCARGEGELLTTDILERLAGSWPPRDFDSLRDVAGITFRAEHGSEETVRTPDRPRISDLDTLPSPYLAGVFDAVPGEAMLMGVIETNRGCPYSCTFCDWGSAINSRVRLFDLDRVNAEIDWLARRQVGVLGVADANFGMFPRDLSIAEHIVQGRARWGAPRQFLVNYAKNTTERVAEIVSLLVRGGVAAHGIIAIQTTDPESLKAIRRTNIRTESYDRLVEVFRSLQIPLTTDLMMAVPGSTPASFKHDLQRFFDKGVSAKAYLTRVLPNSPMADPAYIKEHEITTDELGFIEATRTFNKSERDWMVELYRVYRALLGPQGLTKYFARYVQWEHNIPALDLISELARPEVRRRWPAIAWATECSHGHRKSAGGWARLLGEVLAFAGERFGVAASADAVAVLHAQEAVLPSEGRAFPEKIYLEHDVVSWHRDRVKGGGRPLAEYGPGHLTVDDPYDTCGGHPGKVLSNGGHLIGEWELPSDLNPMVGIRHIREVDELVVPQSPDLAMY